jgi:hypothetical protein
VADRPLPYCELAVLASQTQHQFRNLSGTESQAAKRSVRRAPGNRV